MGPGRFRAVVAVAMVLALLGACTESDDPSEGDGTSSTTEATGTEAGGTASGGATLVQDLWLYHHISTIDADGVEVDLTDEVLDLLGDPAESIDIGGSLVFHRHDELDGRLVSADDEIRDDVDVEVGVLETEDGPVVGVIATPTAAATDPIGDKDRVQIDLTVLEEILAPGDPLFVDIGYVQAWGDGDETGDITGAALLGQRAEAGRINVIGSNDDGGARMVLSAEMGSAVAGSVWSDLPAKAHGMRDGFFKGFQGCKFGIKCVENYFEEMIDVAADFGTAFDCNLGVGRCDLVPTTTTTTTTTSTTTTSTTTTTTTTPPPPSSPTPQNGAKVHGDPHLRTFDGLNYPMQAVGEFVVARNDEIEMQIRTASWGERTDISVLSGVAVGFDDHVLSVTSHGAHLDGELLDLAAVSGPIELGSATFESLGAGYQVVTASGHTIAITSVGSAAFETWVGIDDDDLTSFEGLFGDNDGDPDNDFVTRDGDVVDDSDFDEFYDVFVESWRVDDDESLFHYADGEDTEFFTDRSIPTAPVTLDSLSAAERTRAEAVCRRAGIVDPVTLDQCTLDYALTGDIDFVRAALTLDTVIGVWEGRLLSDGSAADSTGPGPDDGHGPDDDTVDTADGVDVPTVRAPWSMTATEVRQGDEFATRVVCPPGGTAHTVWGTDTYSDDSSVCTAAVHIGLITFDDGGEVLIEHVDGLGSYRASTRNGVTTREWDSWPGSFVFIGARGVPIEGEPTD